MHCGVCAEAIQIKPLEIDIGHLWIWRAFRYGDQLKGVI
jgi:hypothetical protein